MQEKKKRYVGVKMEESLFKRLLQKSEKLKLPWSYLIRQAIEKYLNKE